MNHSFSPLKLIVALAICSSFGGVQLAAKFQQPLIKIIMGSTREGRTSDKIASSISRQLHANENLRIEIIDLRNYQIPFFADAVPPASRTTITDPCMQRWSNAISSADGFIIVVPEYNSGYPGVLKNALDSLYREWNNKPVAFVGYSGGASGGKHALAQLQQVAAALQMRAVETVITIPSSWKAFDQDGSFIDTTIPAQLETMVTTLLSMIPAK